MTSSLKYVIISRMLLIEVLKLFTSFNFYPNLCYKSSFLFSIGADRYNSVVYCSL